MKKANAYEIVNARILGELEAGRIPWVDKAWTGSPSRAYNSVSKKPYSFVNQLLLTHDGEYATFKQWTEKGGHVRKGEKSEAIIFWKLYKTEEKDAAGNLVLDNDGNPETKTIPCLRYYRVFHVSQVEGVEPQERPAVVNEFSPIEQAEQCLGEYRDREGIKLAHEFTGSAYYSPESDGITLPLREQFKSPELYYSVSAHEHVHSTARRVNRTFNYDVEKDRALEECVAQLGSAYLMNTWGIANPTTDDNDVSYIDSWISVIRDNPHAFVTAASRAEKAVKCILGTTE